MKMMIMRMMMMAMMMTMMMMMMMIVDQRKKGNQQRRKAPITRPSVTKACDEDELLSKTTFLQKIRMIFSQKSLFYEGSVY